MASLYRGDAHPHARVSAHLVDLTCMPDVGFSLALGYLEGYARTAAEVSENVTFVKHCHYLARGLDAIERELLAAIASAAEPPAIVAFTVYFWNRRQSLALAAKVKAAYPAIVVLVGGNDVTDQGAVVLDEAAAVDLVANGEGEQVFREVMRRIATGVRRFDDAPGLTMRDGQGGFRTTPRPERIQELDTIPSPFTSGAYAPEALAATRTLVYETNRGCPYSCSFCYWGGATNTKVRSFSMERIRSDLAFILEHLADQSTLFLADANFGMLRQDLEIADLLATLLARSKKTIYLFANWAKNSNERVCQIAHRLFQSRLIAAVTLSAQTFDPVALVKARRKNIPIQRYVDLQQRFGELGIPTYTELLLGLPGETLAAHIAGVERVLDAGGTPVVYPLLLLNNTELATPAARELHRIETRALPYQMDDPSMTADVVVGHASLAPDEWLEGICLRLATALFHNLFAKVLVRSAHLATGIPHTTLVCWLGDALAAGSFGDDLAALHANYRRCFVEPDAYDPELVEARLPAVGIREHLHFQAIGATVLASEERIVAFLHQVTGVLAARLRAEGHPLDGARLDDWRSTQEWLVRGVRAALAGETTVRGVGGGPGRTLREGIAGGRFDAFVLAIYHGSVDVRGIFERPSADPADAHERAA